MVVVGLVCGTLLVGAAIFVVVCLLRRREGLVILRYLDNKNAGSELRILDAAALPQQYDAQKVGKLLLKDNFF